MLSDLFWKSANVVYMILAMIFNVNENIVKIDDSKNVEFASENLFNEPLETN